MSDKSDPTEEINSWEEVAYSNLVQNEALLRLLIKKRIITEEEFVEESKLVHHAMNQNQDE